MRIYRIDMICKGFRMHIIIKGPACYSTVQYTSSYHLSSSVAAKSQLIDGFATTSYINMYILLNIYQVTTTNTQTINN